METTGRKETGMGEYKGKSHFFSHKFLKTYTSIQCKNNIEVRVKIYVEIKK